MFVLKSYDKFSLVVESFPILMIFIKQMKSENFEFLYKTLKMLSGKNFTSYSQVYAAFSLSLFMRANENVKLE
jgi:hypothetical protein